MDAGQLKQDIASKYGGMPVDPEAGASGADDILAKYGGVKAGGDQLASNSPDDILTKFGGVKAGTPEQAEEDRDGDYFGAILRGLKTSLAPMLLSKEDFDGKRNIGEIATEIGTSIATDIASTAGVGAAVGSMAGPAGTAVGAGVGTLAAVGMALYRGFGYEYARSKAKGEDFDPLRGIVGVGAEINPLVSKGGRALKFGVQAGLEGAREYMYEGDKEGAALSGGISGAAAALFHRNTGQLLASLGEVGTRPSSIAARNGMMKEEIGTIGEMAADRSTHGMGRRIENLVNKAREETPEMFEYQEALAKASRDGKNSEAFDDINNFQKWMIRQAGMREGDGVAESFNHYADTLGVNPETGKSRVAEAYEAYAHQKLELEAVAQHNADLAKDVAGVTEVTDPLRDGIGRKLTDIKFQMRKIDRALGTNFDGAVDKFTEAKNKHSVIMASYLEDANRLVKQGRKIGMSNNDIGKVLSAGERGKAIGDLTDDQRQLVDGWRDLFERSRLKLNELGLKVDFLNDGKAGVDYYLPKKALSADQGYTAMRREQKRVTDKYGSDWAEGENSADLRRTAAHILHKMGKIDENDLNLIKTKSQVDSAMGYLLDPKAGKALDGFEASATFQRDKSPVPDFIKSYDVGALFTNYMSTNLKAATHHDAFMQLGASMEMLDKLGMKKSHEYLDRYLRDVSGVPSDSMASMQYQINRYKANLDKALDDAPAKGMKAGFYKAAKDLPDIMGYAIGNIYPNYLGWNIKALLRNYYQAPLMTAPEIGGAYGQKLVAKSMGKLAVDKLKNKVNLEEFLQSKGLAPGKFFGEGMDISADSLRTRKGIGSAIEKIEGVQGSDKWWQAMYLYSQSDLINRYITYNVGQELAKDAVAGNKRAVDFITNKLSEGGKSEIRKLMSEGKTDQLGDSLAKYLISKTQFNYGKESLNEFGREYGRLASMFTKWPAMIMSDVAEGYQVGGVTEGSKKVLNKYLTPMLALSMMGKFLTDTENSPTQRYLLGNDLAEASPIMSFKVSAPPVIKSGMDASEYLMKLFKGDYEDAEAALKGAGKMATRQALSYVPGMTPINEYQRVRKAFWPGEE